MKKSNAGHKTGIFETRVFDNSGRMVLKIRKYKLSKMIKILKDKFD